MIRKEKSPGNVETGMREKKGKEGFLRSPG
jgi:hypothetical protein